MKLVFFETPLFTRLLPEYLDDQEYRALQLALLENPQMGDLIRVQVVFERYDGKILNEVKAKEAVSG